MNTLVALTGVGVALATIVAHIAIHAEYWRAKQFSLPLLFFALLLLVHVFFWFWWIRTVCLIWDACVVIEAVASRATRGGRPDDQPNDRA